MAVPALSAAHTLCEFIHWSVSNLKLQKILYIAQMFHLGEHDKPLIFRILRHGFMDLSCPLSTIMSRGLGTVPFAMYFTGYRKYQRVVLKIFQ